MWQKCCCCCCKLRRNNLRAKNATNKTRTANSTLGKLSPNRFCVRSSKLELKLELATIAAFKNQTALNRSRDLRCAPTATNRSLFAFGSKLAAAKAPPVSRAAYLSLPAPPLATTSRSCANWRPPNKRRATLYKASAVLRRATRVLLAAAMVGASLVASARLGLATTSNNALQAHKRRQRSKQAPLSFLACLFLCSADNYLHALRIVAWAKLTSAQVSKPRQLQPRPPPREHQRANEAALCYFLFSSSSATCNLQTPSN